MERLNSPQQVAVAKPRCDISHLLMVWEKRSARAAQNLLPACLPKRHAGANVSRDELQGAARELPQAASTSALGTAAEKACRSGARHQAGTDTTMLLWATQNRLALHFYDHQILDQQSRCRFNV